MGIVEGTVDLTRTFDRPVADVFQAWAREDAQLAWSDPGEGWEMSFDRFRFTVGESDICRFGPKEGPRYLSESRYLEIETDKRIVFATSLSTGAQLGFAGIVAVTFEPADQGTTMRLLEQGLYFDGRDDVAGHRSGWESMLEALSHYLHA